MPGYGAGPNTPSVPGAEGDASGGFDWGKWLPSILNFGGNILSGITQGSQQNANRQLQSQEFQQQMDLARNSQMMTAANQLNRAPLADKGQYLALNANAAPTPFQPRDYTQGGTGALSTPAQGGAQAQLAANNAAAANYRSGAGGVDTSTLNLIMSRLGGTPKAATNTTTTTSYGGQQYTPEQWSAYLNQHPELAKAGY